MTEQISMPAISEHLPDNRYVQLRRGEKKPLKNSWTTATPLSKQQAQQLLLKGFNIGFLLGAGYVAIDCDHPKLEAAVESLLPETYTQLSARRGLKHFIYKVRGFDKNLSLTLDGKPMGELLCSGKQLVLAPSQFSGKYYTIIKDCVVTEIDREQLVSVLIQFNSQLNQQITEEKKQSQNGDVDYLSITSIVPLTGFSVNSKGQYHGVNPWHGSSTGDNFYVDPSKNLAYCFRCGVAISPIKAVALNAGIITSCSDQLRGADFVKARDIAIQRFNMDPSQPQTIQPEESPELKFWTVKDYIEYRPSKDFIIQGLAYPSEISMCYGEPGSMKSLNMLYKAVCISKGRDYFGKFKTKKQNVAVLSAENSKAVDRDRILKILRGLGIRKKQIPLWILPRDQCGDVLHPSFKANLVKFILDNRITVLFLDTINPLTPEIDDNAARDVTRVFNSLFKELSDIGVYLEFLHHTDKRGNSFLGSTKWKGNADNVSRIERPELENIFTIHNEKNRQGESNTLRVCVNFLDDRITFSLLEESQPSIFKKVGKRRNSAVEKQKSSILEFLTQPLSRTALIQVLKENNQFSSSATLDRALKQLCGDKIRSEEGVYSKI